MLKKCSLFVQVGNDLFIDLLIGAFENLILILCELFDLFSEYGPELGKRI